MKARTRRYTVLFIVLPALCALWCTAALAFAADEFSKLKLTTLDAPSALADVKPLMYFEPDYFGTASVDGKYPTNGDQYVPGGRASAGASVSRGPHGGYDTTTAKCGVCHSAHSAQAAAASEGTVNDRHLLRSGATGCEYCHLAGSIIGAAGASDKIVYTSRDDQSDPVSDYIGVGNSGHAIGVEIAEGIPASTIAGPITLTCASCHTVHGATPSSWMPEDFWGTDGQADNGESTDKVGYKLLRSNPSGTGDPVPTKASGNPNVVTDPKTVNQYTLSVWCTNCHTKAQAVQTSASEVETFTATNKGVHDSEDIATVKDGTMPGPHDATMDGVYAGPTQCYTCHRGSGLPADPAASQALNITDPAAKRLRDLGYFPGSGQAEFDHNRTCSRCHFGTADYALAVSVSDWPHSSAGDVKLLGDWKLSSATPTATVEALSAADIAGPAYRYTCSRCHLATPGEQDSYTISYHLPTHTFSFTNAVDTLGSLEANYSPGYQ